MCWTGARAAAAAAAGADRFVEELRAWTREVAERTRPADRDAPVLLEAEEAEVDRLCVVLSWVECVYREGLHAAADPLTMTPLRQGRPLPSVQELRAAAPDAALVDLRAVVEVAQRSVFDRLRASTGPGEVEVGPVFTGSDDVDGADADWLACGTLLDCKSTVRPVSVGDRGLY